MKKNLQKLLQQAEELQFLQFTSEDALNIGMMLIDKAKKNALAITIDITHHHP
ncbi:MAG: hypothetical protein JW904_10840 [Spirochaetales bacterium]|nr:hypothetical protein [Spirochaetales bacterium]